MQFYSLGETARFLGVKPFRLTYAHTNSSLEEPPRLFGKRAYTEEDIKRAAQHFGVTVDFERGGGEEASHV